MRNLLLAAVAASAFCSPASAAPLDFGFDLTVVTDYRNRGVSVTRGKPALLPDLRVKHPSGARVRLATTPVANTNAGFKLQMAGGLEREFHALTLGAEVAYHAYPGAGRKNYAELMVNAYRPLGPARAGVALYYAPPQASLKGEDNLYAKATAAVPLAGTPLTLRGSAGLEDGAVARCKRDWSVGVAAAIGRVKVALDHVDGSGAKAKPGLVLSLAGRF